MPIEIKVPVLPESVADAVVAKWYKKPGESVKSGESLVDLETDKVMLEVPAVEDGIVQEITKPEGSTVVGEEVLGTLKPGAVAQSAAQSNESPVPALESAAPAQEATVANIAVETELSPAVRRLVAEHGLDAARITGSGKGGRIVKEDVMQVIENKAKPSAAPQVSDPSAMAVPAGERIEKRVPMSRLRARVAERLLQAQESTAMLTTFNEVNMQPVMDLRARHRDHFEKVHDARLGFMSFFVKAAVAALKKFPAVNASIDGNDVVYHGYFDIGVAISSPRGLVVPIIRGADQLSMADIEKAILNYAERAKTGRLEIEELTGGTFTITNGGVFGSMLSTPILNPPQSAILGMHTITKRAVVEDDKVVIRPMMYLALTYDHRIIDGSESVRFLVTIKEYLEDPARLLLDI